MKCKILNELTSPIDKYVWHSMKKHWCIFFFVSAVDFYIFLFVNFFLEWTNYGGNVMKRHQLCMHKWNKASRNRISIGRQNSQCMPFHERFDSVPLNGLLSSFISFAVCIFLSVMVSLYLWVKKSYTHNK